MHHVFVGMGRGGDGYKALFINSAVRSFYRGDGGGGGGEGY